MKLAEEWVQAYGEHDAENRALLVQLVRAAQADAIRWSANLSGPLSRMAALAKADELDPPTPHAKP